MSSADFHRDHNVYAHEYGLEKIEQLLPSLEPGTVVLDVGCADGTIAQQLIARGWEVRGMDVSEAGLESARSKGVPTISADAEKPWPIESGAFSLVLLLDILEHCYDITVVLKEARRVLKEHGSVIIALPNHFDVRQRLEMLFGRGVVHWSERAYPFNSAHTYPHIRFLRLEELFALCRECGLHPVIMQFNFMAGGVLPRRLLPPFVRRWLLAHWPNLFSGKFIVRLEKLASTSPVKRMYLTKTPVGL